MDTSERNTIISGSGTIGGGVYNAIGISGSGRAEGDIKAESVRVSGSGKFQNLQASSLHVSGSCKIDGCLTCGDTHISGSCTVDGDVETDTLRTSGSFGVSGNLRGTEARASGSISIGQGVELEEMSITGSAHIGGLLNADRLVISISASSEIGEIGGNDIEIKRSRKQFNLLAALFGPKKYSSLRCGLIEGTSITLENTICDTVRGRNVIIGHGCEIGKVEYTDTLDVSDDADVGKSIKTA